MTPPQIPCLRVLLTLAVSLTACSGDADSPDANADSGSCTKPLNQFNCPATYDDALAGMADCGTYMSKGGPATSGVWVPSMSLGHCDNLPLGQFSYQSGYEVWCYYSNTGNHALVGAIMQNDTDVFCGNTSFTVNAGDAPAHYYDCHVSTAEKVTDCRYPSDGGATD